MAIFPSWVTVSNVQERDGELSFHLRLRVWHPGFIKQVLAELRRSVDIRLEIGRRSIRVPWLVLAPVLVPCVMWQLRRAQTHTKEMR